MYKFALAMLKKDTKSSLKGFMTQKEEDAVMSLTGLETQMRIVA